MRPLHSALVLLACCGFAPGLQAQTPEAWAAAARAIRRLPPSSFPELLAVVRHALERRGCTVPQSFDSEKPHNVVRGAFARPGQEDWAVLCSTGGRSVVLVFWAGRLTPPPAELGLADDALYLQGIGAGQIGYSRAIGRADTTSIRAHAEAYGGPLPKRLDHDGLEDAFVGKASQILYYEDGAWQELAGAD
jgi:hypothetical protein